MAIFCLQAWNLDPLEPSLKQIPGTVISGTFFVLKTYRVHGIYITSSTFLHCSNILGDCARGSLSVFPITRLSTHFYECTERALTDNSPHQQELIYTVLGIMFRRNDAIDCNIGYTHHQYVAYNGKDSHLVY